ncbi:hypothetical protein, partial [Vibrio sp.]|uniref:hypothetical protein n=1 Tax=Vibrio sp. TaxID=678 RepID=UPI003D136394
MSAISETKTPQHLGRYVLLLWLIVTIVTVYNQYPRLADWDLGDNDNFMRLHQIALFLQNGEWFQKPLADFNPQDGRIIHWSRLADLPVAGMIVLLDKVMVHSQSTLWSVAIVPALYGALFLFAITQYTALMFSRKVALAALVFLPLTVGYSKFMPGSIDHHNLQLMLFASFLALVPFHRLDKVTDLKALFAGLILALSLLIGLESLPFYFGYLLTALLYNEYPPERYSRRTLAYIAMSAGIIGLFGLFTLEPVEYVLTPQFDIASYPLFILIFVAGLSCWFHRDTDTIWPLFLTIVVLTLPILLRFPNVIHSPFHNYPNLLIEYWLNHVTEAVSLWDKLNMDTVKPSSWVALLSFVAPLLSIFVLHTRAQKVQYLLFVISLVPVLFWQTRASTYSLIFAIP